MSCMPSREIRASEQSRPEPLLQGTACSRGLPRTDLMRTITLWQGASQTMRPERFSGFREASFMASGLSLLRLTSRAACLARARLRCLFIRLPARIVFSAVNVQGYVRCRLYHMMIRRRSTLRNAFRALPALSHALTVQGECTVRSLRRAGLPWR